MINTMVRRRLGRWSAACAAPFILAMLIAAPVLAAGPERVEGELSPSFLLPAGEYCDFDLLIENPNGAQDVLIWESDTRIVVRAVGQFFARLTNLDSGESIDISASGPAHIEIDDEFTFFTTGRWVFFPVGGDDGVWIVSGRTDSSVSSASGLESLRGHAIDVCAALG
jgi:hypothetical protein